MNPAEPVPESPKIYHITHVDNLASMLADGCLWSDAQALRRGKLPTAVGMSDIKKRRLEELEVSCHPGTKVGDFVPFYFSPRSVMLYVLHMGNAPGLQYKGGQRPIVHLEADLKETVEWSNSNRHNWAFTTGNAAALYTQGHFYNNLADLRRVNWQAVEADDWRPSLVKEGKQAEFLHHVSFPWHLIRRIGVIDAIWQQEVTKRLKNAKHVTPVHIKPEWYY